MDLKLLRSFVQVAELRSITRAAAVLHVAQPALSRQMRLLEEEFGDTLLERHERGVTLTAAGERLLHRADALVREFDALRGELARSPATLSGHVRFGVPKSLMELLVVPTVAQFRSRHPDVSVTLLEGVTLELREQVQVGALDLAIVSDLDRSPGARLQPLLREPVVLCSHPQDVLRMGRPVGARQLAGLVIGVPNRPNVIRLTLDDVMSRQGLSLRVGLETNSPMAMRGLAASGHMHAVMPYSAAAEQVAAGTLTAAPIRGAEIRWHVAATPLKELPRQAQALRDLLLEQAGRLQGSPAWRAVQRST